MGHEGPIHLSPDDAWQLLLADDERKKRLRRRLYMWLCDNPTAGINRAPTDITLSVSSVAENTNTSGGYSVGTLTSTDADIADTFTYTVVGGADQAKFSIGGAGADELILTDGTLDYEAPTDANADNSYEVTIRTTDFVGATFDKAFSVTVSNVNEAPTDITLSASSVAENTNTSGGYSVGTLTTTDPDNGDTHSYSVVGGADQAKFSIGGAGSDELILTDGTLDYEAPTDANTDNSYEVTVRTTDSGLLTFDKAFSVTVSNVNEAPTVTSGQTRNVDEDAANGTNVGAVLAFTDPESDAATAWAIASQTPSTSPAIFSITSGGQIQIADNTHLDYETTTQYTLSVNVTAGGQTSANENVTVDINDVAEGGYPAILDSALFWLDATNPEADDSSPSAGALTDWKDLNATNNFTVATANQKPVMTDEGGGLWSVVFDGSNDRMYLSGSGCVDPGTNARTVIIAAKWNSGPNGEEMFSLNSLNTTGAANLFWDNEWNGKYTISFGTDHYSQSSISSDATVGHVWTLSMPANATPADMTLRVDGTADSWFFSTGASTLNVTDTAETMLARHNVRGSGSVEIYEIAYWDSDLTAQQKTDVEDYLTAKWSAML